MVRCSAYLPAGSDISHILTKREGVDSDGIRLMDSVCLHWLFWVVFRAKDLIFSLNEDMMLSLSSRLKILFLYFGDLIEPYLMPPSFILCLQPNIHIMKSLIHRQNSSS
jgi:hypothetical protein